MCGEWLHKDNLKEEPRSPPTIVATMRLLALLPTLGLAAQILAVALSSDKDANEMSLAESDAAVAEFFAKLEPATKWTLLHDTTGPEAGAEVRSISPTRTGAARRRFFLFFLFRADYLCLLGLF